MPQVVFYLLEVDRLEGQDTVLALSCKLAQRSSRNRQSCLVLCESQAQAEALDELLWQLPVDSFVPHHLVGEGPRNGTPVAIGWPKAKLPRTDVLINLCQQMPEQSRFARTVYDFVPAAEEAKAQARERYKQFRAAGAQLRTEPAASLTETTHG